MVCREAVNQITHYRLLYRNNTKFMYDVDSEQVYQRLLKLRQGYLFYFISVTFSLLELAQNYRWLPVRLKLTWTSKIHVMAW